MRKILGYEGVDSVRGDISSSHTADLAASKENYMAQSNAYFNSSSGHADNVEATVPQVKEDQARIIYAGHYTGLQTYGLSGMTIQDELIDRALAACENRRSAKQKDHARGAAAGRRAARRAP